MKDRPLPDHAGGIRRTVHSPSDLIPAKMVSIPEDDRQSFVGRELFECRVDCRGLLAVGSRSPGCGVRVNQRGGGLAGRGRME